MGEKHEISIGSDTLLICDIGSSSDLYCSGSGYEIKTSPGLRPSWEKISVSLNGVTIVDDLNENGSSSIQADDVTGAYTQFVRAATVKNGVISSLILAIKLSPDGGYTGLGNAVVYNGSVVTTINGLDCKTP